MVRRFSVTRRPQRPAAVLVAAAVAVLSLALTSCSALQGSSSQGSGSGGNGKVEKAKIKVGALTAIDVAALYVGVNKGYFQQEGLDVEPVVVKSGPQSIPQLQHGDLDITGVNYVSLFSAQDKVGGLKLVSDGYQAGPNTLVLQAPKDSPIKSVNDLRGKKIGTQERGNINELALNAVLEADGVNPAEVQYVPIKFPDMPQALQSKQVDGVLPVEPFITKAAVSVGAKTVLDIASGPAANIPLLGWASTDQFVKGNPKTVAAFQRAMSKAAQDAAQRHEVESVVPKIAGVDKATAALLNFGVFPTSLDAARVQRVADLMQQYGKLSKPLDVKSMIVPAGN